MLLPNFNRFYSGKMLIMLILAGALVITGFIKFSSSPNTKTNTPQLKAQVDKSYGKLPLSFEKNDGQTDSQVDFLARGNGYGFFLTAQGATLSLSQQKSKETNVLRMNLLGANESEPQGLNELPGKSNYFVGNDQNQWKQNVSHFAKVKYNDVYPGIDLVYYGNQKQIEYDFIVAPGSDPKNVILNLDGAKNSAVNDKGELVVKIGKGEMKFHKPLTYQEKNGTRQEIASSYAINDNRISFAIGSYDKTQSLIIDPVLEYSTYLGGSGGELGQDIATDSQGNVYVTGFTGSSDFPTTSAYQQSKHGVRNAFVTKLNASGSAIIFSTYIGGSDADQANAIALDDSENVYITGATGSGDFPLVNAYQTRRSAAFVTKLNASGSALVYSTFLGGDDGTSVGQDIAVDAHNNAYVIGFTSSTNFPTVNAYQGTIGGSRDAFVTKFNSTGSDLIYSTYLGGTDFEDGRGIALDEHDNAYVIGITTSTDFPLEAAYQPSMQGFEDMFVTKFNAAGSALLYSTYLGGSADDYAQDIAIDNSGNAFITGSTASSDFPTSVNAFQKVLQGGAFDDAFVTKMNASGSALVYSTYLGGSYYDHSYSIAIDNSGSAYVTGLTGSTDFPVLNAIQATNNSLRNGDDDSQANDIFVTKVNPSGSALVYSTYLGGGGEEYANAIARDAAGNVYVSGFTVSSDFPTTNAFQPNYGGSQDAFIAKIVETTPVPTPTSVPHDSPTTTATIEPKLASGEYADPAYITLTATAAAGFTPSTYFQLDGNSTQSYVGRFSVSVAGQHTITYWSKDDSDNPEETHKTLTFTVNDTVKDQPISPDHTSVTIGDTTISFSNVTTAGYLTFTASNSNTGGPIPPQYNVLNTFYNIATTATYTGPITISILYDGQNNNQDLKLLHYDGTNWQDITQSNTLIGPGNTYKIVGSSPSLSPFAIVEKKPATPVRKLTTLTPAKVWVGLGSILGAAARFDLKAEAYKDTTLVSSGQVNSFDPGLLTLLGGFSSAKSTTIPFTAFTGVDFPQGSKLNIKLYARTACSGSLSPLGTARLWYNDSQANSQFGATIGGSAKTYYLLNNSLLGTTVGAGPKKTADITGGAPCSAFKSFGTWTITP